MSELALNVPFIQHPDSWHQIYIGNIFQGLSTARGNAALICAGDCLISFLEREVLMFQLLFLVFLTKHYQEHCPKKLLSRNTHGWG